MNHRFGGPAYTVGADTIRLDEKILMEPLSWRKPRMVFVCSMTDLFHEDATDEWITRIFSVMKEAGGHTFQVLTKRPERALAFCQKNYLSCFFGLESAARRGLDPLPLSNLWFGVSVENQEMADRRIPILLQIPAAVRWVSAEPLIAPINLQQSFNIPIGREYVHSRIDWLVVGGESGPSARPFDPQWGRDLLQECRDADIAFFMKQMSGKSPIPSDLAVREWPR
jgi:protein gp37